MDHSLEGYANRLSNQELEFLLKQYADTDDDAYYLSVIKDILNKRKY